MQYKQLGNTDLSVSMLCLGSMTWGEQTSENDGKRQIDAALDAGINFVDTAEMYPTYPMQKSTQGNTERIIGNWIKSTKKRQNVIIATKVTGAGYRAVRDGAPISRHTITQAVENSLTSLNTDYIDLYQLHWPNRGSYMFRQNWNFDPTQQNTHEFHDHIDDVLEGLEGLIREGKIRYIGLSNESAWGTTQWLIHAERTGKPRMISIQNEYSLLCRLYDLDGAEVSHHEHIDLLAYSPLAAGLLTGKYQQGQRPGGSRARAAADLSGRLTARVEDAVEAYLNIARDFEIDPVHLALGWAQTRPFVGSVIFGATTQNQLDHILKGADVKITDEMLEAINRAHKAHPMPF